MGIQGRTPARAAAVLGAAVLTALILGASPAAANGVGGGVFPPSATPGTVDKTVVNPGDGVTITGSGFAPRQVLQVLIGFNLTFITTLASNDQGAYSALVQIPHSTPPGQHPLLVIGPGPQGEIHESIASVIVNGIPSTPPPALAPAPHPAPVHHPDFIVDSPVVVHEPRVHVHPPVVVTPNASGPAATVVIDGRTGEHTVIVPDPTPTPIHIVQAVPGAVPTGVVAAAPAPVAARTTGSLARTGSSPTVPLAAIAIFAIVVGSHLARAGMRRRRAAFYG